MLTLPGRYRPFPSATAAGSCIETKNPWRRLSGHVTDAERYDSEIEGYTFARCPECGTILHLGPGWRGRAVPPCPECDTDGEHDWDRDPRVTMQKFFALVDD